MSLEKGWGVFNFAKRICRPSVDSILGGRPIEYATMQRRHQPC